MLRVEIVEKIATGLGIVVLDMNSKKNLRKEKKKQLWRGLKKKNDENPLRLCPIQQKGITLMNNCEKGKARRQGHL